MIGDEMYFSDFAYTLQNISADEKAVFVSGQPGSGKTFAALQFCAEYKESLYFAFKNLDTAFALRVFCNAHTEIFGACESWKDFFGCLKHYGNKKHPLVFFDNAGERNDKDDFYAALNNFLESDSKTTVILLGRPWETPPIPCREIKSSYLSMPQLADICSLPDETAAKLYCLTGAIPALLSLYNSELSFEDNVKSFLHTDSPFYRFAASWMNESFRTPESYNTLLYAMANGYNRIGEIAKFSGFPKNKCDKYIKALIDADFYGKPLPSCGGKSVPNIFEKIKPYFKKWKAACAFNPVQLDFFGVIDKDMSKLNLVTKKPAEGIKYSMIDLFAGAGGLSEGLEEAGFHGIFASEIVPQYADTYRRNHPSTTVMTQDIRKLDAEDIRKQLGMKKGQLTLIAGGPPCQGFSINAPIRSTLDQRNHLFKEYLRFWSR